MTTTQFHQRHIESQFANDPAIVAVAIETGCVSVDSPEQLPESLRHLSSSLPGLLFWHHPLGGGDPVPQFRPDTPAEGVSKYVFPKDSGTVISITPSMQNRLSADSTRSSKILIVEGTKQAIFAATYAPDDVVVVGIQGCWGWSSDGTAVVALDDLCHGRDVVVAFDADISSNRKVFDAAESLNTQLSTNGSKSVKYVKVPGSKTTGLDDYLASRRADNRALPLTTMINNADLFKRFHKPRVSRALGTGDTFDYISEDLGEVVEAVLESVGDNHQVIKEHESLAIAGTTEEENDISRTIRRASTLLAAAPRIVTTVEEIDNLTSGVESRFYHDIELQIGPKSAATTYLIKDVPDDELAKVRNWIARAGTAGLYASLGRGGQGINGQSRIAEAMRDLAKHSDVERRVVTTHTGWIEVDKTAYWVDGGGAHGHRGKIPTIKARLEGSVAGLDIPGHEPHSLNVVAASIKALLGACDHLYDPTPLIAGVSGILFATSGGHPDGVLYFVGAGGGGKSSITGALASMLGAKWGTGEDPMASIEGTTAYISDIPRQIHNCPIVIDDGRDRSSAREQESQDTATDALIRVGYGGGGAARGKKVQGESSSSPWRQSAASSNRPFIILAGETLPDTAPLSTIERCLVVEIKTSTSMKTAEDSPDGQRGYEYLVNISRTHALQPMLAYHIRGYAWQKTLSLNGQNEQINFAVESLEESRERLETHRTKVAKKVLAEHWPKGSAATPRVEAVTATFIAGASMMRELITTVRDGLDAEYEDEFKWGITDAEIEALEYEWHHRIVLAAAAHASTNLASGSEVDRIIALVHEAVASNDYCFGLPTSSKQTCIGVSVKKPIKIDGIETNCIALIPSVVGKIIGNQHNLKRRMASVLIPDNDGNLTRNININGVQVRCLVIRKSDFNRGTEHDDTAPPPPASTPVNVPLADELSDEDLVDNLARELEDDPSELFVEQLNDDIDEDFDFNDDIDEEFDDVPNDYSPADDFEEFNFVPVEAHTNKREG